MTPEPATVAPAGPPPAVRPFHLLIYSDAPVRGGAEMTLAMLMSRLPQQIRVSVLASRPRWSTGWPATAPAPTPT